jgi:hypothetical protein
VLTKTLAVDDVMNEAGQLETAQEPKVDVDDAKFVAVLPPTITPPAGVVVAFEFRRI